MKATQYPFKHKVFKILGGLLDFRVENVCKVEMRLKVDLNATEPHPE